MALSLIHIYRFFLSLKIMYNVCNVACNQLHFVLFKAAAGHGGRANAQTAGHKRRQGLVRHGVFIGGDMYLLSLIHILQKVRLLNRYDVEGLSKELFDRAVRTVFSEPQLDNVTEALGKDEAVVFAVEYLPGQFDQRADSAAQCIQILSQGARPLVRSARVYRLYGQLGDADIAAIRCV